MERLEYHEDEYFYESEMEFALLGTSIAVMVDKEGADFEFAQRCAEALNRMEAHTVDELCRCSVRYCRDFCDQVGEEPPVLACDRDILNYIQPSALVVPAPEGEEVVLHLELNCDWEPEHGLEWLVRGDRVLHVGAYTGEPPYEGDEYYRNSWNYVHKPLEGETE